MSVTIAKLINFVQSKLFFRLGIALVILIFLLLSLKNPFSDRSVISNLEPYPDTLLYSLPVWNWLNGDGLVIRSFGLEIKNVIPLTYGFMLMPFMWLFKDIRAFYFGNELMMLASVLLVIFTIKRIGKDFKWVNVVSLFCGFLLATNFYIYTQPQLMMAENVNILMISLFFYLLCFKIDYKTGTIFGIILMLTGSIKTTNIPIAGMMLGWWLMKLIIENIWPKKQLRKYVVVVFLMGLSLLSWYILPRFPGLNGESFNWKYLGPNFDFYLKVITGGDNRYLWYYQPLFTRDIFVLATMGIIYGFFKKRYRMFTFSGLSIILIFMLAMSLFRDTEGRYMAIFLPIIMVLAAFGMEMILVKVRNDFIAMLLIGLLLTINMIQTFPEQDKKLLKIISIKRQIVMNIKYREDPWNYIALEYMNNYFNNIGAGDDVYLGTLLPPFYVDLFSNKRYQYLPITKRQEFPDLWYKVYNQGDMERYYETLLTSGKRIYVTDYYINANQKWKEDYITLLSKFETNLVWQSPLDNANIYELRLKK